MCVSRGIADLVQVQGIEPTGRQADQGHKRRMTNRTFDRGGFGQKVNETAIKIVYNRDVSSKQDIGLPGRAFRSGRLGTKDWR